MDGVISYMHAILVCAAWFHPWHLHIDTSHVYGYHHIPIASLAQSHCPCHGSSSIPCRMVSAITFAFLLANIFLAVASTVRPVNTFAFLIAITTANNT